MSADDLAKWNEKMCVSSEAFLSFPVCIGLLPLLFEFALLLWQHVTVGKRRQSVRLVLLFNAER